MSNKRNSLMAILAGGFGTIIEATDFIIYGLLSSIISKQLFPAGDPLVALMSAYGVFFVGFVARPFGSIVFGPWGDKFGRKKAMVFTMLIMAASTAAIGFIPTYAQIGILCPILVIICRILQGLAMGAEWGTTATYMYEFANPNKRAWISSWRSAGAGLGVFVAGAVIYLTNMFVQPGEMPIIGWRICFVLAGLLGVLGLIIRLNVPESPEYEKMKENKEIVKNPLAETLKNSKKGLLILSGLACGGNVFYFYLFAYLPGFLTSKGILAYAASMEMTNILSIIYCITILIVGWLSDSMNKLRFMLVSMLGFVILSYPVFLLAQSASFMMITSMMGVLSVLGGMFWGSAPVVIAELFPAKVRNTAVSVGYACSNAVFGGITPLAATWLSATTGRFEMSSIYLIAASAIGVWAILKTPQEQENGASQDIGCSKG